MLPEVEEYQRAVDEARQKYDSAPYPPYPASGDPEYLAKRDAYHQAERDAYAAFTAAKTRAWNTLVETTTDPLARWLLTDSRVNSYPDERMTTLKALPLDLEGLSNLAADCGWCEVFDRILPLIIQDGAITVPNQERYEVQHIMRQSGIMGSSYRRVMAQIDAYLANAIDREELTSFVTRFVKWDDSAVMSAVETYRTAHAAQNHEQSS